MGVGDAFFVGEAGDVVAEEDGADVEGGFFGVFEGDGLVVEAGADVSPAGALEGGGGFFGGAVFLAVGEAFEVFGEALLLADDGDGFEDVVVVAEAAALGSELAAGLAGASHLNADVHWSPSE